MNWLRYTHKTGFILTLLIILAPVRVQAAEGVVHLTEEGTDPDIIIVNQGDTIQWINKTARPIQIEGNDCAYPDAFCIETPIIFPDESAVTEVGEDTEIDDYQYWSKLGDYMQGIVTVLPKGSAPTGIKASDLPDDPIVPTGSTKRPVPEPTPKTQVPAPTPKTQVPAPAPMPPPAPRPPPSPPVAASIPTNPNTNHFGAPGTNPLTQRGKTTIVGDTGAPIFLLVPLLAIGAGITLFRARRKCYRTTSPSR